jgi:hypothetical protein
MSFHRAKGFDGFSVDWETNYLIPNTKFLKVPLMNELVNTLVERFPYLTIDMVWLIHKKKTGDGFQKWHKDFALGAKITNTVVVNLACINKSATCNLEQEPKAMGNNSRREDTIDLETNQKSLRENAIKQKNPQQAINPVKYIKW